jgi:hypothetical protein
VIVVTGYHELLTVPVGATSITVQEEDTSSNYLGNCVHCILGIFYWLLFCKCAPFYICHYVLALKLIY